MTKKLIRGWQGADDCGADKLVSTMAKYMPLHQMKYVAPRHQQQYRSLSQILHYARAHAKGWVRCHAYTQKGLGKVCKCTSVHNAFSNHFDLSFYQWNDQSHSHHHTFYYSYHSHFHHLFAWLSLRLVEELIYLNSDSCLHVVFYKPPPEVVATC